MNFRPSKDGCGQTRNVGEQPRKGVLVVALVVIGLLPAAPAAGVPLDRTIYADALATGWANWSWSSAVDFASTQPYSGSRSISWRINAAWGGLYLHTDEAVATLDTASLRFALRATEADQRVSVTLHGENNQQLSAPRPLSQLGGNPPGGSWKAYEIALSELGGAGKKITGVTLQDGKGSSQPPILVDDVKLAGLPSPSGGDPLGGVEIRPENTAANNTRGRPTDPAKFNSDEAFRPYYAKINGDYVGTTDQILAWAARKWGFDDLGYPDLAKAQAVVETWWRQGAIGAHGELGILQVHPDHWPDAGPAGWSTAYSADYAMAVVRYYYDGNSWLGSSTKGSIRNSVAAWECGCGSNGGGAYANAVFTYYDSKPWLRPNQPPEWF